MNDKSQLLAKNTIFLYIRMIVILLISLYTSRIIIENLGIGNFGVYNVVAGFVSMFSIFTASMSTSIQRYYNFEYGKNGIKGFNEVFISSVYIQILLIILVVLIAETIGYWYIINKLVIDNVEFDEVIWVYQISIFSLVITILKIPYEAAVIAKERMNFYAIVGIIDIFLKLLFVLSLSYVEKNKLVLYTLFVGISTVINFIVFFVYCKFKINGLLFKFIFNKILFRNLLKFSTLSTFNGFSQVVQNQGLNLILNIFFGPIVNAARGISYQIKSAIISFVQNILMAVRPQIVESYAIGNVRRSVLITYSISKISFLVFYLMLLPIVYEIDLILNFWLGSNVPDHTSSLTILILLCAMVDILQSPICMIIYADGQITQYNFVSSILGLITLPIAYILLSHISFPEIVYFLTLLISILNLGISVFIMCKNIKLKFKDYFRLVISPITKIILLTCWIPIIISEFIEPNIYRSLYTFLSCILSVSVLSYVIAFNTQEKEYIKFVFIRIVRKIF